MGEVLSFTKGTIQGHSDWLFSEAQCILAEEVQLHLVMENCWERAIIRHGNIPVDNF